MKTSSKLTTLALASVVITGCVSMSVPDDFCGIPCQKELRKQREAEFLNSGRMYNTHLSQEYRDAMAHSREENRFWTDGKQAERITTTGPDLSAYGTVGAEGYSKVAACKNNVNRVVRDMGQRERFDRMCYDLLPVQHREKFYANDKRVPSYDPPVIIVID